MTTYDTAAPVYVRVGDRREWNVGDVPARRGNPDPHAVGALLIAVGEYMHHLLDVEQGRRATQNTQESPT